MLLSEHVYCVAVAFKMAEWVEQQIYVKFCVKLEHSSTETIQMTQKATAMGNWWLAASSHNTPAHASHLVQSFFCETSNHPGDSAPYSPDLVPCDLWLFPKLNHWWDSGKYDRAAGGTWENCVRSQGAYFKGDGDVIVLHTMFLVFWIFFNKCLFFSLHGWLPSGQTSYITMFKGFFLSTLSKPHSLPSLRIFSARHRKDDLTITAKTKWNTTNKCRSPWGHHG